jgi:hypothetical protein
MPDYGLSAQIVRVVSPLSAYAAIKIPNPVTIGYLAEKNSSSGV